MGYREWWCCHHCKVWILVLNAVQTLQTFHQKNRSRNHTVWTGLKNPLITNKGNSLFISSSSGEIFVTCKFLQIFPVRQDLFLLRIVIKILQRQVELFLAKLVDWWVLIYSSDGSKEKGPTPPVQFSPLSCSFRGKLAKILSWQHQPLGLTSPLGESLLRKYVKYCSNVFAMIHCGYLDLPSYL